MDAVYILFSRTQSRMGDLIRFATGAVYNHVSVACREDLADLMSFARRYYSAPFYGGFVEECIERYCKNGSYAQVLLCRIPVNSEQADAILTRISQMKQNPDHYIYDLAAAAAVPFGFTSRHRDAYTCLDFAKEILTLSGFNCSRILSLQDLQKLLSDNVVYRGTIDAFSLPSKPEYLQKMCLGHILSLSWRAFRELFRRDIQK